MPDLRIEHDSMGEVKVPAERLYGAQTARSLENFSIGCDIMPMELVYSIVRIKKAIAEANAELGALEADKASAVSAACDTILKGEMKAEFPLHVWQTGSGTQTNMNVNEVIAHIAARAGVELHGNDHVNRGQSTNDVFPAATNIMAVMDTESRLLPALARAEAVIGGLMAQYGDTVKLGRTHLQDATPLTLGQELSAWKCMLAEDAAMIKQSTERLRALPLGGTAVGTGLNAAPGLGALAAAKLTALCGTEFTEDKNKFHGLSSRAPIACAHGALKALAADMMKLANDVRFLASGPRGGIGELMLPENEPGSSIMPGKVNPTQCEALCMVSARVMGNDVSMSIAAAGGQLQLNTYMPMIAHIYLESVRLLSDAVDSFTLRCLSGIKPNKARIEEHLASSLMLVTALVPRIGYENAAKAAQNAQKNGTTLKRAAVSLGLLTEDEYDAIVDPRSMV